MQGWSSDLQSRLVFATYLGYDFIFHFSAWVNSALGINNY